MYIDFALLGWMLLFTTSEAVLLLICMGVFGCLWPSSSKFTLAGTASQALTNIAPDSASVADDITVLMI